MKKQLSLIFIITIAILFLSTFTLAHDGEDHTAEEPESITKKILTNPFVITGFSLLIIFATLSYFSNKKRSSKRNTKQEINYMISNLIFSTSF